MKRIKMLIAGALSALMLPAVLSPAAMVNAQEETQNPSELLLGIFFNSQEDQKQSINPTLRTSCASQEKNHALRK